MLIGWLKWHRKAIHSPELRDDVAALGFWVWLLSQAAHKPTRVYRGKGGRRVDLAVGQAVIAASSVPGMTRKRAETLLFRFRDAGMIQVESRRDIGHTITIANWLEYQDHSAISDGPSDIQGAYKGQTKAKQGATAQEEQEIQESKNQTPNGVYVAAAAGDPLPAKPLALKDRYPTKAKLPRSGRGIEYPAEFESAWQAYPTRPEDAKAGCYQHWRKAVVDERIPWQRIRDGAEAYAFLWAGKEYRWGFRRWLEERAWNNPVLKPSSRDGPSIRDRVREAAEAERRGDDWDPFGFDGDGHATGPEIEHRALPEVHRDDADGGTQDAADDSGRSGGSGSSLCADVVPLFPGGRHGGVS